MYNFRQLSIQSRRVYVYQRFTSIRCVGFSGYSDPGAVDMTKVTVEEAPNEYQVSPTN